DMRVSSRRLRGALNDFSPYLRKRVVSNSLKEIKSLADALGAVRDQDVAIIGLQRLTGKAAEQASATLKHFIRVRNPIRKKARRDLRRSLNRRALERMQNKFVAALESPIKKAASRSTRKKPDVSYLEVSRSMVRRRLKELEALSDCFYHPLKIKPLHKMRIAAKHLRYALELSEQCLGPATTMFAKKVANLQTSLGELHDADLWIETFGEQLEIAEREASKDRIAGSLWLLNHFVRLHSKHLRDALAQWEDWETNDFSNKLRELLNPEPSDESSS
ncbi:MAG TPA: CHAD domain-containing protein, partial [Pyrinomonadaceae bacterium]|nr:CHAD domain-containing protein [Pyrinomonadaceae bacterium]